LKHERKRTRRNKKIGNQGKKNARRRNNVSTMRLTIDCSNEPQQSDMRMFTQTIHLSQERLIALEKRSSTNVVERKTERTEKEGMKIFKELKMELSLNLDDL
jgi:hypothetical protein